MAERITRSIRGTPAMGVRGLLSPFCRSRLPWPAAIIRHCIPIASVAIDRTLCHQERFIVGEPFWWMFAEDGPMALSICLPVHGSMPLSRTGWNLSLYTHLRAHETKANLVCR